MAVNSPVARALVAAVEAREIVQPVGQLHREPAAGPEPDGRLFPDQDHRSHRPVENLGAAGVGTSAQNSAVQAILNANGFASVGAARFFLNGLDTTTQGVDAVATYRADLGTLAIGT
ncbi:hypothetical protein AB5I41_06945 [Sphingomonas sp. MMS24-JH45]